MSIIPASNRLQALDQLRALAVLFVLLSHFGIAINSNLIEIQNNSINLGTIGVFIFFCVSGYVIPWSMQSRDKSQPTTARSFWVRRILRLYPIYLAAGILGVFALGDRHAAEAVAKAFTDAPVAYLLSFLTMTTFWQDTPTIFQGLEWTLAYEMLFYVACSVYLAFQGKLSNTPSLIVLVLAICGLTLAPDLISTDNRIQKFFLMYAFFIVGLLTYLYKNGSISKNTFIALSCCVVATIAVRNSLWYVYWGINYLTYAFIPALFIFYAVSFERIIIYSKTLTTIGIVSYSIYLTHIFIPHNIPLAGLPPLARFFAWLTIAVLVAIPLYRYIELPAINKSRTILHRQLA
ncbi:Acyltransferase family protein [compost metagenome]